MQIKVNLTFSSLSLSLIVSHNEGYIKSFKYLCQHRWSILLPLVAHVFKMGDQAWQKFKAQMRNKRTAKGKQKPDNSCPASGELIVQSSSSSVSQKAQKGICGIPSR